MEETPPALPVEPPPEPAPNPPPPPDAYFMPSKAPAKDTDEPPCDKDRGEAPMTVGGILMGVAGALGIAGGIAVATGSIAGAYLLTGGGLLLLAGLITLIVGSVMAANKPNCW